MFTLIYFCESAYAGDKHQMWTFVCYRNDMSKRQYLQDVCVRCDFLEL